MPVIQTPFNNFFIIDNGKAVDVGNTVPKTAENDPSITQIALVREFKTGGNKASRPQVSNLNEAKAMAKEITLADEGRSLRVVIVAKGQKKRFKGDPLFKDVVGFKFRK